MASYTNAKYMLYSYWWRM